MSGLIVNQWPELTGSGAGFQKASAQLPAAPTGWKKMRFFWRAYVTGVTTAEAQLLESNSHDNSFCFGLSFDGLFPAEHATDPERDPITKFLGMVNEGKHGAGVDFADERDELPAKVSQYGSIEWFMAHGGYTIGGGSWIDNKCSFHNAFNATPPFELDDAATDLTTITNAEHFMFPIGSAAGAKFSSMWEVSKSAVDDTLSYRIRQTMDAVSTLAGTESASLIGAEKAGTIHGDVSGNNWTNADGSLNMPRYILIRWPWSAGYTFRLDQCEVRYYDRNDDLLGVAP